MWCLHRFQPIKQMQNLIGCCEIIEPWVAKSKGNWVNQCSVGKLKHFADFAKKGKPDGNVLDDLFHCSLQWFCPL